MRNSTKNRAKSYIISILIALAAGGISSIFAMSAMEEYNQLRQPAFAPPSWIFPIVWTILFILMGISAARVYLADTEDTPSALRVYALQLIVNIIWTPLYFTFNLRLAAFIWLMLLFILVLIMTIRFNRVDKTAAILQIPYIIWLVYAGYLNLGTYILNG